MLAPEVSAGIRESANAVELRSVVKVYGQGDKAVTALGDVSLSVRHNEFFTLLGPSGCGKTTLLRLIAGFELLTAGEILLDGAPIARLPPERRPVNTVFQHYALFPHLSVAENVAFGLRRLGRPEREVAATVAEMLTLVRLQGLGARRPQQLSGGQQQRVALARALAPRPRVLLLDEPLSALDLKLRQAMRQELQRLQRETGITFLFVTHDQDEALAMSDRIAVLSEGALHQVGTPEEIYQRPATRFVADFIGDTNFIDATVVATGTDGVVCRIVQGVEVRVPDGGGLVAGAAITLSVRPEHVLIEPPESGDLRGRVCARTYLGDTSLYTIEIGPNLQLTARRSNIHAQLEDLPLHGPVSVRFATDAIRILRA